MTAGALAGVRVLDLSRLLPGPFCTLVLSDLGADVVKVEDPHAGDYLRAIPPSRDGVGGRFAALNRDKRSVVLDLKAPAGRDALLRLAPRFDVVLESFRPGVLDRLGVGYERLSAAHPAVILCSISGYGQTGPYRERAGHDLNYEALAGVLGLGGDAGGRPWHPGLPIADLAGGALWAAVGILAALVERGRTGRGRHLDLSMAEGTLALAAADLGAMDAAGRAPERGAELLTGGAACYGLYETKDGRYLSVAGLEPKFWLAFNAAIGRAADASEVVAPPERQRAARAEIAAILRTRTRAEWEARFAAVDACVEPVLGLDELEAHPLHQARRALFRVGPFLQARTPFGEADGHRAPPRQGEHTDEVLREHGFSAEEIAALRAGGAAR